MRVPLRFVEEQTQSQIGVVLGVSQMQVSRLLAVILGKLLEAGVSGAETETANKTRINANFR